MRPSTLILFAYCLSCGVKPTVTTIDHGPGRNALWTVSRAERSDAITFGGQQDTLWISSPEGGIARHFPVPGIVTRVKWHPEGALLAVAVQGGQTKPAILHVTSGTRIELDSINGFGARTVDWSPNGELLAVGDYDGKLTVHTREGRWLSTYSTGQKGIIDVDWHPNGRRLVAVGENIAIIDVESGSYSTVQARPEAVLLLCVEWHPSGDHFVTGDYGDTELGHAPALQFWDSHGRHRLSITEPGGAYRDLRWSPDGKLLATASDKLRLYDGAGELIAEVASGDPLWGVDWRSDGTTIVTTDEGGAVAIWDLELTRLGEVDY